MEAHWIGLSCLESWLFTIPSRPMFAAPLLEDPKLTREIAPAATSDFNPPCDTLVVRLLSTKEVNSNPKALQPRFSDRRPASRGRPAQRGHPAQRGRPAQIPRGFREYC